MRFLIGVDGSSEAARGLEFVRTLPLTADDEVVLLAVAEVPIGLASFAGPPAMLGWYDELHADVVARCRAIVDEARASVAGAANVVAEVVDGHALHELLRLSRDRHVDAVVVGPHGQGAIEALVMGSVSQGLLHDSSVPVLIARSIRRELQTVLIAVDGSTGSRAAVRWLARMPLPETTAIIAVAIVPKHDGPYGRAWSDELFAAVEAAERAAANEALESAVATLGRAGRPVRVAIRSGQVKTSILQAAEEAGADLIVLGARGLGGFEGLVVGSVSRSVAKAASCSVLVVRGGSKVDAS